MARNLNVAALEWSDNVADRDHAFAVLKRGYPARKSSCKMCDAPFPTSIVFLTVGLDLASRPQWAS